MLVSLPILVAIVFSILDPGFLQPLVSTVLGNLLLGVAALLLLLGWVATRLAIQVDL